MAQAPAPARLPNSRLIRWLLKGQYPEQQGPYSRSDSSLSTRGGR